MIVCTRCGASNQPTSKFCLSCGAPLAASAGPGAPQHAPPPPQPAPPQPAPPKHAPPPQPPPAQWGAPPPYAPPPQGAPAPYGPPQQQPPQAPPQQPPQWGGGGYAPPPQPNWGPPPAQFSPSDPQQRYQAGSPEGLNPFGATFSPHNAPVAPQYGHPPGAPSPQAAPPQQQHGPPPGYAPAQGWPPPEPNWGPPPAAANAPQAAPPVHSNDPAAYAATSPPPTNEEFERGQSPRAPQAVSPSAPPAFAPPAEPAPLRSLAGFLVSYEPSELGVFWPIYQGQNVVGRKGAAPGLDIEIDHPTTSSRHAVLHATARPGRIRLEDPGSTNGTFLGDQMLEKGKQHELRDGDSVRFGGFNVIVKVV